MFGLAAGGLFWNQMVLGPYPVLVVGWVCFGLMCLSFIFTLLEICCINELNRLLRDKLREVINEKTIGMDYSGVNGDGDKLLMNNLDDDDIFDDENQNEEAEVSII